MSLQDDERNIPLMHEQKVPPNSSKRAALWAPLGGEGVSPKQDYPRSMMAVKQAEKNVAYKMRG